MNTDLRKKIKEVLKQSGMSQADLARELGVSRAMINNWITGDSNPKLASLKKISLATRTPLSFFLGNDISNSRIGVGTIELLDGKDKELAIQKNELIDTKRELDLTKRELELQKKENELLKHEKDLLLKNKKEKTK